MDPIIEFLAEDVLSNKSKEAERYEELLHDSGYPKTGGYTKGHSVESILVIPRPKVIRWALSVVPPPIKG